METAKEKVIREAYGEYWELCRPDLDGWSLIHTFRKTNICYSKIEENVDGEQWRPKELTGIENNNGWNSILLKEFPESEETVLWLNNEDYEMKISCMMTTDFNIKDYTHWHRLPFNPPIF